MPWEADFWTKLLEDVLGSLAIWLPRLLVALLLLLVGWIIARLAQALVAGVLRRLGLDKAAEKAGVSSFLSEIGAKPSVASLLGRLVYWMILLIFVLAAVESLGLPGIETAIGAVIAYLPQVLAATLILVVGGFIARIVGDGIGALAVRSGISNGMVMGLVIRYVLLFLVILFALEQLRLQTALLTAIALVLFAAVTLTLALAFGLGNRELARNVMAGFHARDVFTPGQTLTVRNHTGRLVNIGAATSILETEGGQVSIPNDTLINEEVLIAPASEDTA